MKKGDAYFRGRLCCVHLKMNFVAAEEKRRKRRNKNKMDSKIGQNREEGEGNDKKRGRRERERAREREVGVVVITPPHPRIKAEIQRPLYLDRQTVLWRVTKTRTRACFSCVCM